MRLICLSLLACLLAPLASARGAGVVSEIRAGMLLHDAGIITNHVEDGADGNVEVLFVSPDALDVIWSPRPDLGVSLNDLGLTNQLYFGLTWHWQPLSWLWGEFSFGPGFNDGKLNEANVERKGLGSPVNFRESLSVGWQIGAHSSLSILFDHISNGGLAGYNGGMDGLGLRYGYRF